MQRKKWFQKQVFSALMAGLLLVSSVPMTAQAEGNTGAGSGYEETEAATTGTLGEHNGITWRYDEGTKTLTVSGEDELYGVYDREEGEYVSAFWEICHTWDVEQISFVNCKLAGNAQYLFSGLNKLKVIDVAGLDTSEVTDMGYMFF